MCWSGEASACLAAVGLATTGYAAYKKEAPALWVSLGYFSLMELLQAYTYAVINQCSLPSNQIATLLGYLHIVFQPFFINAVSMYFIEERIRKKIAPFVYTLCFASTIIMLIQLYPLDWAGKCASGRALCGPNLCSVSGNWHIAWLLPVNGIGNYLSQLTVPVINSGFFTYTLVGFILPIFYGSWRFTVYHLLVGPMLAMLTTNNPNEWPAVWCLFSIGLLLIVIKTPVRQIIFVRSWFLWPKAVEKSLIETDKAAGEEYGQAGI